MRRAAFGIALAGFAFVATGAAGHLAYIDGPPVGHTGGFGEPSCHACHFDNAVNDEAGILIVSGFPTRYAEGEVYPIAVEVRRPGTVRAGFQAAVRYASGESVGRDAGVLRTVDRRTELVRTDSVTYVQHTPEGSFAEGESGRWELEWTAPSESEDGIVLHTAANAGNDDNSAFGDYIFVSEDLSRAHR